MATEHRSRGGGAETPSRTRPGGVWSVFEDFKPTSEWQQDDESHTLVIYLPGFAKEQIRVSTEGRNIIRVRGERLVAGNKWSRFLEDFQVPENSEMNSVTARFQGGVLNIRVPKKPRIVDKPQEAPAPPTKPHKVQEDKSLEPQKTSGVADKKETIELKEKHTASERADEVIQKTVEKKENLEKSEELPNDKKTTKKHDGAVATSEATKKERKSKGKEIIQSGGGSTMEKYKKAVKGLADLDEETQLLVNMGAAVLVIMALSAYVTYKFVSEDKK